MREDCRRWASWEKGHLTDFPYVLQAAIAARPSEGNPVLPCDDRRALFKFTDFLNKYLQIVKWWAFLNFDQSPIYLTHKTLVISMRTYNGHCHCRAIRYQITLDDDGGFQEPPEYDCCVSCRRVSGALLVNAIVMNLIRRAGGFSSCSGSWYGWTDATSWLYTGHLNMLRDSFARYVDLSSPTKISKETKNYQRRERRKRLMSLWELWMRMFYGEIVISFRIALPGSKIRCLGWDAYSDRIQMTRISNLLECIFNLNAWPSTWLSTQNVDPIHSPCSCLFRSF